MDDGLGKIEIFPDYFVVSTPPKDCLQKQSSTSSQPRADYCSRSHTCSWSGRKLMNLFSPRGLPWRSSSNDDKVTLTVGELESLRSEIAGVEESEAHLKAQLENVDEILRSARLAGYLCIRTRWTPLPGEPHIDDSDVDDWLPRFVVLYGSCMFFYFHSTDLSPQDSTLLSDVVEVGPLPSFLHEDQQMRYSFYILTRQGLRLECSSISKIQVDSWLAAMSVDCRFESDAAGPKNSTNS